MTKEMYIRFQAWQELCRQSNQRIPSMEELYELEIEEDRENTYNHNMRLLEIEQENQYD